MPWCARKQDRVPRRARRRSGAGRSDRSGGVCRRVAGVEPRVPLRREGRRLGKVARVSNRLHRRDRTLARAAAGGRRRLASCTSARPAPMAILPIKQAPIDESAPLGQNVWILDYYTRSKVECERLLWRMAEAGESSLDRDPAELALWRARPDDCPRLIREFRRGRMMIVGKGDNPLSAVYCRSRRRRRDPGSPRSRLPGRGVQRHQPGPDHPARVSGPVCRCARGSANHAARSVLAWPSRAVSSSSFRTGCCLRARPPRVTRYGAWLLGRLWNTAPRKPARGWGGSPRPATPRASGGRSSGFGNRKRTPRQSRDGPAEPVSQTSATQKGALERPPGALAGAGARRLAGCWRGGRGAFDREHAPKADIGQPLVEGNAFPVRQVPGL